jgi:hypothetical protein
MIAPTKLVQEFAQALDLGEGAVFIGAGLPRRAGYPGWRELLANVADELEISLDQEPDLAGVAQWFINHSGTERSRIAQIVRDSFPPQSDVPLPYRILSRLPIRDVWTTNYDKLVERAWELVCRGLDVKSRVQDLAVRDRTASTVLYKMHGTVDHPTEIVIATDDFETYRRSRAAFLPILHAHLLSQTFLFIGVSFTDPNIKFLLGLIREQMGSEKRQHYAVVRRPAPEGDLDKRLQKVHEARHRHWVNDLRRYGIQCVEVDRHDEIDGILGSIAQRLSRRSVFVSGSWPLELLSTPEGAKIQATAEAVGRQIAEAGLRLISGFGLTVGGAAIAGALAQLYTSATPNLDRALLLRPFPQQLPPNIDETAFRTRYREDLIEHAGIAVFIAGGVLQDQTIRSAPGVMDEYRIARAKSRIIIPIAATGGAAAEILRNLEEEPPHSESAAPVELLNRLADTELTPEALALALAEGIRNLRRT